MHFALTFAVGLTSRQERLHMARLVELAFGPLRVRDFVVQSERVIKPRPGNLLTTGCHMQI